MQTSIGSKVLGWVNGCINISTGSGSEFWEESGEEIQQKQIKNSRQSRLFRLAGFCKGTLLKTCGSYETVFVCSD